MTSRAIGVLGRTLLRVKNRINLTRRLDYAPDDILLHVDSMTEYGTRLGSCAKEPETVTWIEGFEPGDVFYDVGANVGAYSLVAAKRFSGTVRVYAFEAAFVNFAQLNRNILLNGCQGTIVPLGIALSDATVLGAFNYHDLVAGGALHVLGQAVDYKGDAFQPVATQPVLSFRLDDIVQQFGLRPPTHLKIDVDGIELAVLNGAARALAGSALRSVLVETQQGVTDAPITNFLTSFGFRLGATHRLRTPGMANSLFLRDRV